MKNKKSKDKARKTNIETGAEIAPGTSSLKEKCESFDNMQQERCGEKNNKKKK